MFKTLQFRLALFNLIILIAFLGIFSGFIYFQTSYGMVTASNETAKRIVMRIETDGTLPPFIHMDRMDTFSKLNDDDKKIHPKDVKFDERQNDTVIIIRDMNSNITLTNTTSQKLTEATTKLSQKLTSEKPSFFTEISADGKDYRIYTTFFTNHNKPGIIQVCDNISIEKIMLSKLVYALLLLGIVSILILFAISWVLAWQAIKPIKASWEKERRFIADASHELKTPLTIMRANLDIPMSELDPENSEHYLWIKNAYDETENMQNIVNELLELVKIDTGYQNLKKENFDISDTIHQSINQLKPLIVEKDLEMIEKIKDDITIYGNKEKLRQMFIILLDNALQYTNSGQIEVAIDIQGTNAMLTVSDTGVGRLIRASFLHLTSVGSNSG